MRRGKLTLSKIEPVFTREINVNDALFINMMILMSKVIKTLSNINKKGIINSSHQKKQ